MKEHHDDIDTRCLKTFNELGFDIEIHPSLSLLKASHDHMLWLKIIKTPTFFKRLHPNEPLIIGFGYDLVNIEDRLSTIEDEDEDEYLDEYETENLNFEKIITRESTHIISTRTSSGRSLLEGYLQEILCLVLAKETNGYLFYDTGLFKKITSLSECIDCLDYLKEQDKHIDAGGYMFREWPPSESNSLNHCLAWSAPIESDPLDEKKITKSSKSLVKPWWKLW